MLEYIKTSQFYKLRLRNETDSLEPIYITPSKINSLGGFDLVNLYVNQNKLTADNNFYNVIDEDVKINLNLLERRPIPSEPLYQTMVNNLLGVSLDPLDPRTDYFDVFLEYRNQRVELFFTVDEFSGRVQTAITNFHRAYRPNLKLFNEPTIGLDVFQMQPTILGKILHYMVGDNEFSNHINQGTDVYVLLQKKLKLKDRDTAKKYMFKILFGYPDKNLSQIFGNANWIEWINEYKTNPDALNQKIKMDSKGHESYHNNLAFLLQTTEVAIMKDVWQSLADNNIPFLSVHDEVIVQKSRKTEALNLFNKALQKHFVKFHVSCKADENKQLTAKQIDVLKTIVLPLNCSFSIKEVQALISNQFKITEVRAYEAVKHLLNYNLMQKIPKHGLFYTNNPF
jgi:hypothetical protein